MKDINALLARNCGVILARDNRALKSSLSRWVGQGKLIRPLRGVYMHPGAGPTDSARAGLAPRPNSTTTDEADLLSQATMRLWALAKRAYRDLLVDRHITGWVANQAIRAGDSICVPDIAFPAERLALEIDILTYRGDGFVDETDWYQHNALVSAGWTVLRFTWGMLDEPDLVIDTVNAVRMRLRHARGREARGTARRAA